jgi:hypothetical protein
MRKSNHQIHALLEKEKAARREKWKQERQAFKERKERRQQLKLFEVFSEAFASHVIKSISYYPTTANVTGVNKTACRLGDELAAKGHSREVIYQSLGFSKGQGRSNTI